MDLIPVHRPALPTLKHIAPYIDRIDQARWYSNFGPLLKEFESRLATHFSVLPEMVATASNGTLMLTAILKALNVPQGTLCLMPSWTFIATAAAACYAGLIPYFVDVDRNTQALDPAQLMQELSSIKQPVGAVIVVAPFGAPIDIKSWDAFSDATNIPVIIDAAAAFDTVGRFPQMEVSRSVSMISLHATKVFGIGEGGLALSTNAELIWKIRSMTGFGFNLNRESMILGFNAKLSEYTAAAGLASLDLWEETRSRWAMVRDDYMAALEKTGVKHHLSFEWISSTCNIFFPNQAEFIASELKSRGIDTRKWWLNGCHNHDAYKHFPTSKDLSNTNFLSQSVLGLPFAMDLEKKLVQYICDSLSSIFDHIQEHEDRESSLICL